MSSTKTTWEDLSRLGWPKYDVYKRANSERGGTMGSEKDLYLNTGIAADYQWWSYNVVIGKPYILSRVPNAVSRDETAWRYDNSQNSESFTDSWTESWSNSRSASLSITSSMSITLNYSVTIFDVASSGLDLSISTESSSTESKEEHYDLSHTWDIVVGPHEKVSLIRTITTASEVAEYGQDFGLSSDSRVGTDGSKWEGHYYWGMGLNWLLGSPRGRLNLQGSSRDVTYAFTIVREGPNGTRVEPLPADFERDVKGVGKKPSPEIIKKWAGQVRRPIADGPAEVMVPGPK
ncbi:hypothetical protein FOMPIDRAFT_82673 [Fomitopsis schrenkii]|uniref:Cytolysin n=1 Tax=Fomitopsis schrenkii TaxID=2126942 RepID=S8E2V8_FOMSC|nr:hypothetical protein FOMPIDRAFT_82673 [Fomitopsis schrenkii]